MTKRASICGVLLCIVLVQTAWADYAAGKRAYDKGDHATAFKEWRPLAEQGDANAQCGLGNMYYQGKGVAQDNAEAAKWYRKAAYHGNASAQFQLGFMYFEGQGVAQGYAEAVRWYRKAADQGNAYAQINLGGMYYQGQGVAHDYAEAVRWYRKAADQGNAGAQFNLGAIYSQGHGVAQDDAEAVRWLRKAADQGNASAQSSLASSYAEGKGVAQDDAEAVRWYRKAADQGDAYSQSSLGSSYATGKGVAQDDAEAVRWYRKAANQGDAYAQSRLGDMYDDGKGVLQDYVEATRWYRKAADQGDAVHQFNLGNRYYEGLKAPKDYVEAHIWLNLAASHASGTLGTLPAIVRDSLAKQMTPQQIAEAQRRARDWKPGESAGTPEPRMAALPKAVDPDSSGTGFWVNREGHILTNHHVVDGCTVLSVKTLSGRQTVKVLAQDKENDLAVVGPAKLNYAPLAFSENQRLKLGQGIITVGYPLQGLLASSLSLTTGTISAVAGIQDDTRMVQITAPVQPGNSGGPLLDQSGNVIGIVSSKLNSLKAASVLGDVTQNINFAVKGSVARTFLDSSGVNYVSSPSSATIETTVIGEKAKNTVALVECWR